MPAENQCLDCGEIFFGRIDKLYCSVYCKSSYHYKKNTANEDSNFKRIDRQLKLNRRLLKHFNRAGKSTIRTNKLTSSGFDPKYFTHYWKNKNNQVYLFCYDVGFLKLTERDISKYLIIDWQEYMTASN
jgi:hypothetical protein